MKYRTHAYSRAGARDPGQQLTTRIKPKKRWKIGEPGGLRMSERSMDIGVPYLARCDQLQTLLSQLPRCVATVHVGDNSKDGLSRDDLDIPEHASLSIHRLEFDAGIGACRARVAAESDAEFLAVIDSDMILPKSFGALVDVLEADESLGAVSGILDEHGELRAGVTDFHSEGSKLVQSVREPKSLERVGGHPVTNCDKLPNAMVARRECIDDYSWDSELKDAEHLDWFLAHHETTEWEFAVCPEVIVRHETSDNRAYVPVDSSQRSAECKVRALEKWGYDGLVRGRRWFSTQDRSTPERVWKAIEPSVPPRVGTPVKRVVEGLLR